MTLAELNEALAGAAHGVWAEWMRYQCTMCIQNFDGSLTIPKDLVERWTRQAVTSYNDLADSEKPSDRDVANRHIMPVITPCILIQNEKS